MERGTELARNRRNHEADRRSGRRDRSRSRERDDDRHNKREKKHDIKDKFDEIDSRSSADRIQPPRVEPYRSDPPPPFLSGTPGSTIGKGAGKGRWYNSVPNNIILVRELPEDAVENDMVEELAKKGVHVKNVRIMRSKDTGQSLRYCFVEFNQVSEAQYWMEINQGEMRFRDAFTLSMYYSTTRRGNLNSAPTGYEQTMVEPNAGPMDWTCNKCSCTNFQRRTHCRRCSHAKEEFERPLHATNVNDGRDQVGINLCNTLLLRGLDGLTTEENILNAFAKATSYPVKNVRVIRDGLTGASNGYAFVEMTSLKESKDFVECITQQDTPLEIDGKAVIIAYAKNTFTTALATIESQQQQQLNYHAQQQGYYDYNAYYSAYQAAQANADMSQGAANSTNAAAAVAQAAIMQKRAFSTAGSQQSVQTSGYTVYPVPDVSTYTYDETSGYYYDASTGLYYDPNTQYYYNPQAEIFMYWDGEKQTYLPAPSSAGSTPDVGAHPSGSNATSTEDNKDTTEVDDEKKKSAEKKVKVAKKIAKDMEKWAKKMNAQKESLREEINRALPQGKQSGAADAGFSLLEKSSYRPSGETPTRETTAAATAATAATVTSPPPPSAAAISESSAGPSRVEASQQSAAATEEELTDWNKMACLLCRRAFPSKDVLVKHQQLSELHKSNLQELINSRAKTTDSDSLAQTLQYRDRAKERRDKYGVPEPPLPSKKSKAEAARAAAAEPIPFEQPTQDGLKDDNIGNKLLQKMGWKDGMGLGRGNQGIVNPIEAKQRHATAGLGARGSAYNIDPASGTYKERARKTFQMYFQDINE